MDVDINRYCYSVEFDETGKNYIGKVQEFPSCTVTGQDQGDVLKATREAVRVIVEH